MICDTSSLECKYCEKSNSEDGETDDEWACGRCEEDGVDKVGHLGASISGVWGIGVWYSSAGLGATDFGGCAAGCKQRRGGCRRYLRGRERRNAMVFRQCFVDCGG